MLKLAFRNLFRQKSRTAMTLTVIVFGVVGIILSGGFVQDIFVQLRDATIHSRLGHVQVYAEGYYELGRREPYRYMIKDPEYFSDQLRGWPAVSNVMQRVNFSGLLNNGATDLPIIGEGIEADKEAELGSFFFIIEGRQLTDRDANGVLLGEGVSRSLKKGPGEFVTLLVNTLDGALNTLELEVVGVFRTFSKEYDDRAIRIDLEAAKELLDTEAVHSLVLFLNDTQATDDTARTLRAALDGYGYEVWTWLELDDFYSKTVELYKRQFGVLQIIILFIVLLSVMNSVGMTVNERTGEFGTLRALGKRADEVYGQVILENVLLGAAGAALGVLVGVLAAYGISQAGIPMPPPPNSNAGYTAYIRIVPDIVAKASIIGFVATVLSAMVAARRPTRLPIVDALRANI